MIHYSIHKDCERIPRPTFLRYIASAACTRLIDRQEPLPRDKMKTKGLRFLIPAALILSLIAEPTLHIKLDNAGRGRSRNTGSRRRTGGLGVQIGRGRGIQIGRGGGGRSNSRGDGGLGVGGVFGGRNEDISSRRPRPEDDYDGTETENVGAQSSERLKVSVAVVLPYSVFKKKSYSKKIIQV